MKLRLRSDFHDFYDHHFDREGPFFDRLSRNNLSRSEQMKILESMGQRTPRYCRGAEVEPDDKLWVVHFDEYAHRGEGKAIRTGSHIRTRPQFSDKLAVEFIDNQGHSHRHLQIGNRAWVLSYHSRDDWRSNCGDVDVHVVSEVYPMEQRYPIFAIDYVTRADHGYAIDLNTSPGMTGTGIELHLPPAKVFQLIKDAVEAHPSIP